MANPDKMLGVSSLGTEQNGGELISDREKSAQPRLSEVGGCIRYMSELNACVSPELPALTKAGIIPDTCLGLNGAGALGALYRLANTSSSRMNSALGRDTKGCRYETISG
jgi:hypothetical protein